MRGKIISSLAAAAVLLLFFLPWVTIAGGAAAATQITGYELALSSAGPADSALRLVPLAAVAVLVLLLLATLNAHWAGLAGWGQGAVALVALLVLGWKLLPIGDRAAALAGVVIEPALWGTGLSLVLIVVGAILGLVRSRPKLTGTGRQASQPLAPAVPPPQQVAGGSGRPQSGVSDTLDLAGEPGPEDSIDDNQSPFVPPTIFDNLSTPAPVPSTASLASDYSPPETLISTNKGLDEVDPEATRQFIPWQSEISPDFSADDSPPGQLLPKTEVLVPEQEPLAWLVIRSGEPLGKQFRVRQAMTIGRDPNSDIYINDTAVSGRHAEVIIEDGHFFIYDRGSTNGVLVYVTENDRWEKVERHELKDGSQIKLGRTVFHLLMLAIDDQ